MDAQSAKVLLDTVSFFMIFTFLFFIMSYIVFAIYGKLKIFFLKKKIEKFDLSTFTVVCNHRGLPTTLISKVDSKVVIL